MQETRLVVRVVTEVVIVAEDSWLGLGMDGAFAPPPPLPSPRAEQYHTPSSHIFIGPDVRFPNPNRLPPSCTSPAVRPSH